MSSYSPPTENVPIFDALLFRAGEETLTQAQADKRYLRYPIAQGAETLQAINVNGVASMNNAVNINTSQLSVIQPSLRIGASNTGDYSVNVIPRTNQGAYNPITQNNDTLIYGDRLPLAPPYPVVNLVLTTHSQTHTGVRIAPTSCSIGAGSSSITATTEVKCDGTNVVVKPDLKFPDNTIQNSAFTGAGASAGSYTNTNLTLDSNGKITAIASGSSGSPTIYSFTTAGTFTQAVPATASQVSIICIGGGGSGGGGLFYQFGVVPANEILQGASGGGGGGLSVNSVKINSVSVPNLYIQVGGGGAGAALSANGNSGGSSFVKKNNNTGAFLCEATGGQGGKVAVASLSATTTTSTNSGGLGGSGTYSGGNGGAGGYFNGTGVVAGVVGLRSNTNAPAGGGGGGAIYTPDAGITYQYSAGGAGGSVGVSFSVSGGVGNGAGGAINTNGGVPSADYINDFVGSGGGGGGGSSNVSGTSVAIPVSGNMSAYYGAGSGGAGVGRFNIFGSTGGTSGNGGTGAVWLIFE